MRPIVLALATTALLASGCGNPCQDLGSRLCDCTPAGTTKASCVDSVKAEIQRNSPGKDAEAECTERLRTCYARKNPETGEDISFCDWLDGRCGKAACGLSDEDYDTLASTPADAASPDGPTICPQ
jgi:hypothetical protein